MTLDLLLGGPRASVLRLLDRPMPIGRVAEALQGVPSMATHHVRALEGMGLVRRERDGARTLVSRTPRGDGLLALYAE